METYISLFTYLDSQLFYLQRLQISKINNLGDRQCTLQIKSMYSVVSHLLGENISFL